MERQSQNFAHKNIMLEGWTTHTTSFVRNEYTFMCLSTVYHSCMPYRRYTFKALSLISLMPSALKVSGSAYELRFASNTMTSGVFRAYLGHISSAPFQAYVSLQTFGSKAYTKLTQLLFMECAKSR